MGGWASAPGGNIGRGGEKLLPQIPSNDGMGGDGAAGAASGRPYKIGVFSPRYPMIHWKAYPAANDPPMPEPR